MLIGGAAWRERHLGHGPLKKMADRGFGQCARRRANHGFRFWRTR